MKRRLVVLPEAEAELLGTAAWYEGERQGLCLEFVGRIDEALGRMSENPAASGPWPDDARYRRHVVRRFPYAVFFEIRDDHIEGVAIAHCSREPGYWRTRS